MKTDERKGEFGQRLAALLVRNGHNQSSFARAVGIERTLINRYIGKRGIEPDRKHLRRILLVFKDEDARALICGQDNGE